MSVALPESPPRDQPTTAAVGGGSGLDPMPSRLRDPEDVAALYDAHGAVALALAFRIVADHAIAEDVVQEALLSVWRARAAFDPRRGSLRAWWLTAVRNRAIDRTRRRWRPRLDLPLEVAERTAADGSVEDEVSARSDAATLRSAVAGLPREQATVLELAYFSGFTQAEISRITGAPLGTVKSRTRLALRALTGALRGSGLGAIPA